MNTGDFKAGWVGVPPESCSGCCVQKNSPNGDFGVDALLNSLAHELAEAATDPTGKTS